MSAKKYGKEVSLKFYQEMKRVRAFDLKASELFTQGQMAGNIHTCIGQEATAVGACQALEPDDFVVLTHRGHGQCLARGGYPHIMMAELFGKATGYCKGKGGSMHIADLNLGILGANGIVGAGIPIGTGSALTSKIMNKNEVTLIFFGDGASNTGYFHESLNMASAWDLPAVFFCENNKYGVSVCIDRICKVKNIAERAAAYDIPGVAIDGYDVFAVYEAVKKAAARARKGQGPTLIEAKTYRYHGHYEGDPQVYRTKEEVAEWKNRDAIERLRNEIIALGLATDEEVTAIDKVVQQEIEEAVEFAKNSPYPEPEQVTEDVYAMDNEMGVAR
ncbi:MAG: thiamine pyrophosphate-dependent dehydrogenase E1 component subunit alpha [Bacillota bacterium]